MPDIDANLIEFITRVRCAMLQDKWFDEVTTAQTKLLLLRIKKIVGTEDKHRYEFLSALLGIPIISQRQPYITKFRAGRLINLLEENYAAATSLHIELSRHLESKVISRAQNFYKPDVEEGTSAVPDMLQMAYELGGVPHARVAGDEAESAGEFPA